VSEAPAFFVPGATSDNQESIFASLAEFAAQPVPAIGKRLYSITYGHDGEEWTATVGESLRGLRHQHARSKTRTLERPSVSRPPVSVSDPAVVLAIFSGNPYVVVTDHRIRRNVGSAWENPFYARRPESVIHFSAP
jgi:hypothetical protein